jgi:tetratricopeptide (TPR) repeat protein
MIRLEDEFLPTRRQGLSDAEVGEWARLLQNGRPAEKQRALLKLIAAGAEAALVECLRSKDPITVQFATDGLWECWLNEKGSKARQKMEQGIRLMEAGELAEAFEVFRALAKAHPDWVEAINKQATVLYLQIRLKESLELCRQVVERKPHHFGAWSGMALCAVRMEDWQTALNAATQALRLQPRAETNREIVKLARSKLGAS